MLRMTGWSVSPKCLAALGKVRPLVPGKVRPEVPGRVASGGGRLKADLLVILGTVHHVKIKSLPYAVTKQRSCILAVCLTGRQLMAISWHARISAEKMTACFR